MKNFKAFYESQTVIILKEIVQFPLPTRNFWTEIYRNMQIFAFQVLQEHSSWASKNSAVQMFFLTLTSRKMFLVVLQEYIFYNVDWVEVRKISEGFWTKLYCRMSDHFW